MIINHDDKAPGIVALTSNWEETVPVSSMIVDNGYMPSWTVMETSNQEETVTVYNHQTSKRQKNGCLWGIMVVMESK